MYSSVARGFMLGTKNLPDEDPRSSISIRSPAASNRASRIRLRRLRPQEAARGSEFAAGW